MHVEVVVRCVIILFTTRGGCVNSEGSLLLHFVKGALSGQQVEILEDLEVEGGLHQIDDVEVLGDAIFTFLVDLDPAVALDAASHLISHEG